MEMSDYLRKTFLLARRRLEKDVLNEEGLPYEKRFIFSEIKSAVDHFLEGKKTKRIFLLPGLRGAGKTTLLAQIYFYLLTKTRENQVIYLTVDELKKLLGKNLNDFLEAYESFTSTYLEEKQDKLFLLIDEIHYDENWAAALKTIYDKSKNIFVLATGSSSLALQTPSDLTRRSFMIKIPPLSFQEYLYLKYRLPPFSSLLIENILASENPSVLFPKIKKLEKEIKRFLLQIKPKELALYLKSGSLPLSLEIEEENVYPQIFKVVDKVIAEDLPKIENLSKPVFDKAWPLLSLIAESEKLNYEKMLGRLKIAKATLKQLLDSLLKAELITPIKPYGSAGKMVRKSIKYLFTAPVVRASILFDLGRNLDDEMVLGKFLEEITALYFLLSAQKNKFAVYYDAEKGGADFILINKKDNSRIVIEVGYGQKDIKQVIQTAKKVKAKYGLIISEKPLALDKENQIVYLPKEFFLASL